MSSRLIFGMSGVMTNLKIQFNILFDMSAERTFFSFDRSCSWVWWHFVKVVDEALKLAKKITFFFLQVFACAGEWIDFYVFLVLLARYLIKHTIMIFCDVALFTYNTYPNTNFHTFLKKSSKNQCFLQYFIHEQDILQKKSTSTFTIKALWMLYMRVLYMVTFSGHSEHSNIDFWYKYIIIIDSCAEY